MKSPTRKQNHREPGPFKCYPSATDLLPHPPQRGMLSPLEGKSPSQNYPNPQHRANTSRIISVKRRLVPNHGDRPECNTWHTNADLLWVPLLSINHIDLNSTSRALQWRHPCYSFHHSHLPYWHYFFCYPEYVRVAKTNSNPSLLLVFYIMYCYFVLFTLCPLYNVRNSTPT